MFDAQAYRNSVYFHENIYGSFCLSIYTSKNDRVSVEFKNSISRSYPQRNRENADELLNKLVAQEELRQHPRPLPAEKIVVEKSDNYGCEGLCGIVISQWSIIRGMNDKCWIEHIFCPPRSNAQVSVSLQTWDTMDQATAAWKAGNATMISRN